MVLTDPPRNRTLSRVISGGIHWLEYRTGLMNDVISATTLSIDDRRIRFTVDCNEDFKRSTGHGERDVLRDFGDLVTGGDIVWDVGANVGSYSLLAALSGATVHAFEPAPDALSRLYRNVELNDVGDAITVHEVALGSEEGTGTLQRESRSGVRGLTETGDGDEVVVTTGDSLDLPSPDVVKIDVEGNEVNAIRGMTEHLEQTDVCIVEYHDERDEERIVETLQPLGFSVTREYETNLLKLER